MTERDLHFSPDEDDRQLAEDPGYDEWLNSRPSMSPQEEEAAFRFYEQWEAAHCEHGVPPDNFCQDCDNRYREPWE